jgi:hypothetical protein
MESKPLTHNDTSGFELVKDLLQGDATFAINFDRLQKHPKYGYIIFEFLQCGASQTVTPYTSHPNKYWNKNKQKFIALFEVAQKLNANLYLVNYAKPDTLHADKIKLIHVKAIDPIKGITEEQTKEYTKTAFSEWFRKLNEACKA